MKIRVGLGFDTHRLEANRPLIIGGVAIEYHKGCAGHSDADVLLHAVIDALFGAANLRDIGYHFPDTDMQYKNIDSLLLLQKSWKIVAQKGWTIENLDCTIVLQEPKLLPYIDKMKKKIADTLLLSTDDVSIKAKTSENIGFIGRKEGVSAYAVVLLSQ